MLVHSVWPKRNEGQELGLSWGIHAQCLSGDILEPECAEKNTAFGCQSWTDLEL